MCLSVSCSGLLKFLALVAVSYLFPLPIASADPRPVLRIGVLQSLSGIGAEDGTTVLQALQIAAEEINAGGRTGRGANRRGRMERIRNAR